MVDGVIPAAPRARVHDLRDGLRDAFAGEVATRLPALREGFAAMRATGDPLIAREVVRHVHTLASSAAVLGEDLASQHARKCELLLVEHLDAARPLPEADLQAAAEHLATLEMLLAPWLAGPGHDVA